MKRQDFCREIGELFGVNPVVALLGPRQCGKTTLARQYIDDQVADFPGELNYFDLEDPGDLARLDQPKLALQGLTGLVVIDEVQRAPGLFELLRVLVDRPDNPARFLILGSASRDLIRQSSESLAGRISYVEVTPFAASEVGAEALDTLWLRGGFPRAYLADDERISRRWRDDYIRTYLERDLPALGIQVPPPAMRRFWLMLVHYHGQIFNASEIGKSLGVSDTAATRYLDTLTGTFMMRRLSPWFENLGKRQRKRPKLYFRDSGILHALLGVGTWQELQLHPKLGASWEGFALEEVIRLAGAQEEETYYWAVHQQAELDLLLVKDGKRLGYELKFTDRPTATRSAQQAAELLGLDALTVVHPGHGRTPLADRIEAVGLRTLVEEG